jgi:flavin-dependent dehydrogenase
MASNQMRLARRVTEVNATGEFSFRSKRLTGDRRVLEGDAAGFIDPVWSSGVFIAVLSGEKAADMLDQVLREPARRRPSSTVMNGESVRSWICT